MNGGLKMALARMWSERGIQVLVLVSFLLQVILLSFSGIRRRNISVVLKILLWLAYLLADSTATYALGHLTYISNRSSPKHQHQHQLVAFWAPFLLLHLGGQDTITAYSLEDNELWLRHLLTLATQVLGAAYVVYRAIIDGTLLAPAILMFVVGVVKYGERVWALRCATMDNIRSSIEKSSDKVERSSSKLKDMLDNNNQNMKKQQENMVLGAHLLFDIFKRLFVDLMIEWESWDLWAYRDLRHHGTVEGIYRMVEIELSLMYDILYTKAAVIHTWYGYCIRVMSSVATTASLVLFVISNRDGYNRADVTITFVLLVGASVLEIVSILRALVSTWTCKFLNARKCHRSLRVVLCLRRLMIGEGNREWSNHMGQYNLISFCTRDRAEIRGRIAKMIGLENKWNKSHYSTFEPVSPTVKELILQELEKKAETTEMEATPADFRNYRGSWVLERSGLFDRLGWSVSGIDLDESILVWHIATDIFLHFHDKSTEPKEGDDSDQGSLPMAVKALSNYMLFLLVVHPYMLPGPVRRSRYVDTCNDLVEFWSYSLKDEFKGFVPGPHEMLMVMEESLKEYYSGQPNLSALAKGAKLAKMLLCLDSDVSDKLGVIAAVWVEMMCFAANNCTGNFHAKQLSCGGELLTSVWLLMAHVGVEGHLLQRPLADYGKALFSGDYVVYRGQVGHAIGDDSNGGHVVYRGRRREQTTTGQHSGNNVGEGDAAIGEMSVAVDDDDMEITEEHETA